MLTPVSVGLAAWALAAAVWDWQRRRVPNALLLPVLVAALLALAINGNGLLGMGWTASLMGLAIGGGPLLPGYALGLMGAGDVKLSAVLGFLLGGAGALEMLLIAASLIGLASLAVLISHRIGGPAARRIPAAPAFAAAFGFELFHGRVLALGFLA